MDQRLSNKAGDLGEFHEGNELCGRRKIFFIVGQNYSWKEMRMIGFQAGEDTDQAGKLLAADTWDCAPGPWLVNTPRAGRWLVGHWARHGGPRARTACSDARQRIMRRNSGQSSAGPGHCDTELLRVRKIRVLCFSLQKRTTKIGQKTAGCQSRLTLALVNHWARIIWNNCNLTALWCTPFRSLGTHFKVG